VFEAFLARDRSRRVNRPLSRPRVMNRAYKLPVAACAVKNARKGRKRVGVRVGFNLADSDAHALDRFAMVAT
jgi:hypothetical protein